MDQRAITRAATVASGGVRAYPRRHGGQRRFARGHLGELTQQVPFEMAQQRPTTSNNGAGYPTVRLPALRLKSGTLRLSSPGR